MNVCSNSLTLEREEEDTREEDVDDKMRTGAEVMCDWVWWWWWWW